VRIVEIDAPDRLKLRHTLSGLHDSLNADMSIPPKF
jgi:hypothetical protein